MSGEEPRFATARLTVQPATAADAPLIFALGTDPRMMIAVGFPRRITLAEVKARLTLTQPVAC